MLLLCNFFIDNFTSIELKNMYVATSYEQTLHSHQEASSVNVLYCRTGALGEERPKRLNIFNSDIHPLKVTFVLIEQV